MSSSSEPRSGRDKSMPSSSAAMRAIEARLPPMSGEPVSTLTVPSSFTFTVAEEFMHLIMSELTE